MWLGRGTGDDYARRLAAIDWSGFETAHGSATDVPRALRDLVSRRNSTALHAAVVLDGMLCHQHVRVDSAAPPALPFLIEAIDVASQRTREQIMCTIRGMAACIRWASEEHPALYDAQPWIPALHRALVADTPRWETLKDDSESEIAFHADGILEALFSPGVPELGLD